MNDTVTTPETVSTESTTVAKANKPKAKPVAAKKESKTKIVKKSEPSTDKYGINRDRDLPWSDKKVAIFKALKTLKAVDAYSARSAKDIAVKAGLVDKAGAPDTMTVRHYCYHAKAAGLVSVNQTEEVRGYSFALTKKGLSINPVEELKAAK